MDKSSTAETRIEVTLSEKAWAKVQFIAAELKVSVSELLERVGQGELVIMDAEKIEDLLDTIDGLEGLLEAKEEGTVPWEEVKAELEL